MKIYLYKLAQDRLTIHSTYQKFNNIYYLTDLDVSEIKKLANHYFKMFLEYFMGIYLFPMKFSFKCVLHEFYSTSQANTISFFLNTCHVTSATSGLHVTHMNCSLVTIGALFVFFVLIYDIKLYYLIEKKVQSIFLMPSMTLF